MEVKEKKENRCRAWSAILYVDELPDNIIDKIKDLHLEYCVSPLHTPADEKPHRHLYLGFEGKKSIEQIKEILLSISELADNGKSIKGIATPQKVLSKRNLLRYFVHLDDKDKQQFSADEKQAMIENSNVEDLESYLNESAKNLKLGCVRWVLNSPAETFLELVELCIDEKPDYFGDIQKNSYFYSKIIEQKKVKITKCYVKDTCLN